MDKDFITKQLDLTDRILDIIERTSDEVKFKKDEIEGTLNSFNREFFFQRGKKYIEKKWGDLKPMDVIPCPR